MGWWALDKHDWFETKNQHKWEGEKENVWTMKPLKRVGGMMPRRSFSFLRSWKEREKYRKSLEPSSCTDAKRANCHKLEIENEEEKEETTFLQLSDLASTCFHKNGLSSAVHWDDLIDAKQPHHDSIHHYLDMKVNQKRIEKVWETKTTIVVCRCISVSEVHFSLEESSFLISLSSLDWTCTYLLTLGLCGWRLSQVEPTETEVTMIRCFL